LAWFFCWMIALSAYERGAAEATGRMTPPGWTGNPWGPAATRARLAGELSPIPMTPEMAKWDQWGKKALRNGDIVFRLGDARTLLGWFPLSYLIAQATASPFSHTGIIAIEDGATVVYDCSSSGIQRQPFHVWMLDCVGPLGVKRLKPEHRGRIPGVLGFCRKVFVQQVPFDYEFRMDDTKFYCLEFTEKAFRSQGLALSEPVRIGDWEDLVNYPLTAFAFLRFSGLALNQPITLDQPVYLPGNDRSGIWASPLLETVFSSAPKLAGVAAAGQAGGLNLRGDFALAMFVVGELRRSYSELPVRWLCDVVLTLRPLARAGSAAPSQASVTVSRRPSSRPL
jgi:hypothetical protein